VARQQGTVARADQALAALRQEIADTEAKAHVAAEERAMVRARLALAERRVARLRADIERVPEALAAARAALLIAPDRATEAEKLHELTDLQQQIVDWQRELAALEGDEQRAAEADDAARIAELERLQHALVEQRAEAHAAFGQALYAQLRAQLAEREAATAAARAAVQEAEAAQEAAKAQLVSAVTPWKDLAQQVRLEYGPITSYDASGRALQLVARAWLAYYHVLEQYGAACPAVVDGVNVCVMLGLDEQELMPLIRQSGGSRIAVSRQADYISNWAR
jgi:chromosome segregation ATPase